MNVRPKTVKRLLIIAGVVAVLVAAALIARAVNESRRKARLMAERNAGIAAYEQGDFPAALEHLKGYVRPGLTDVDALRAFATSRAKVETPNNRHLAEAIQYFELLRSLRPDDRDVAHALLDLYTKAGYATEATRLADSVLSRNPVDTDAIRAKAIALLRSARYDDALALSQQLNDAAPFDLSAHLQTYRLLRRTKATQVQILSRYQKLLDSHPADPRFEMLLGIAYGEGGNREKALELLRAAGGRPAPDAEFVAQLAGVFDQQRLFEDSQKLLQQAAERSNDPAILRVLIQRMWQNGEHLKVVERLAGVESASLKSDSQLLALRILSLLALNRSDDAGQLLEQLSKRGDGAAISWAAAIKTRMSAGTLSPTQLITQYQSAIARGNESGIIRSWIGDAHQQLGEPDKAMAQWQRATEVMPSWAEPHVQIARAKLAMNQPADAADEAIAAVRCAPDQVAPMTTLALARYALLQQSPAAEDQAKLAQLIAEIQRRLPGEPETLPLHAAMLARGGDKPAAIAAINDAIARKINFDADVLANLLAVSREFSLGVEPALLASTTARASVSPRMALRHALEASATGHWAEGLARLQASADAAPPADALAWQIASAQFQELSHSERAAAAWVALGDAWPDDFTVQSLILRSASSAQSDREFFRRTIDRVHELTGDDGTLWKYARAKFLLTGQPSQRDSAEAVTTLTDLVRASPNMPEYRVRLAQAMENLGNARDAAEQLKQAAQIDPRSVAVQLQLARMLQEQGKHPEARACLDRAAASPLIEVSHRLPLAQMLDDEGRADLARQILSAAPSRTLTGDLLLASLLQRAGDFTAAEAIYTQQLQESSTPELVAAAADFYASRGQVELGRELLARIAAPPSSGDLSLPARFEERWGDSAKARQLFEANASAHGDDSAAWRRLVMFFGRQNDFTAAIAAADRGLNQLPADSELKSLRLQAAAMQKVSAGTTTDLSPLIEALALDPSRAAEAQALRAMQETLAATQPSAVQIVKLQQSADRFPAYLPLQALLAKQYLAAGQNEDAANVAQHVLSTLTNDPSAAELATDVFRAARQWALMKQAAAQWQRLIPSEADRIIPATAQAEADLKRSRPDDALAAVTPFLAAAAKQPEKHKATLRIAAQAMMAARQPDRVDDLLGPLLAVSPAARLTWMRVLAEAPVDAPLAAEWLDRVRVSIDPSSASEAAAFARTGSVVASRFKDPAAARMSRDMLKPFTAGETPDAQAHFLSAALSLQLGDMKSAEESCRAALALKPDYAEALNDLAYLLMVRKGDLAEAKSLAERATRLSPESATNFDTLARIESARGNREASLAAYSRALTLDPTNVEAMIGKAWELRAAGEFQQARKMLVQIEPLLASSPALGEPVQLQLQSLRQEQTRGE